MGRAARGDGLPASARQRCTWLAISASVRRSSSPSSAARRGADSKGGPLKTARGTQRVLALHAAHESAQQNSVGEAVASSPVSQPSQFEASILRQLMDKSL
mmetsp:Transcript_56442/g.129608  ORF Transcript_56442/g.129608 Transcript_56442/m.129608 type:complete len:101 (-) Transcript_56442:202-504(-)|eukprot:CAMPEP_0119387952 /NCGR_PEP_ID=MMETSP1334-20130426/102859_1 /TAXON_ID=127549 /ORGANISM="Calcidiscus leptoporus, Strain RCC1130" /LENGTH=100 /DNA_ID=CAMNT_0007409807 /DNA_START=206 /DNA_END=508 /DNA_ORIENTATION=-